MYFKISGSIQIQNYQPAGLILFVIVTKRHWRALYSPLVFDSQLKVINKLYFIVKKRLVGIPPPLVFDTKSKAGP